MNFRPAAQIYLKLVSLASKQSPGAIHVTLPFVREDIPLAVVFRALGIESDKVFTLPVLLVSPSPSSQALLLPHSRTPYASLCFSLSLPFLTLISTFLGHHSTHRLRSE